MQLGRGPAASVATTPSDQGPHASSRTAFAQALSFSDFHSASCDSLLYRAESQEARKAP